MKTQNDKNENDKSEYIRNGNCRKKESYDQVSLAGGINTKWAGKPVCFYESLDSTNTRAQSAAQDGAGHGTLIVADRQTAGKGRRGRSWMSPAGTNIYFTIILKPDFGPDKASMLTLVMAHSVAAAIRQRIGLEAQIKWPNDVVVNGRKVVGILTEMGVEHGGIRHVIIGVGINVYEQEFPPELAEKATSLAAERGAAADRCKLLDRGDLLAAVMLQFETDYEKFVAAGNLAPLRESYHAMLVNLGREVCVLDPKGEYRGIAEGITDQGELLVKLSDGSTSKIYAGEVSVRGILGYV